VVQRKHGGHWINWAIRATAGVLVLSLIALAYVMISTALQDRAATPAARAIANLERIVRENPENVNARLRLADAFMASGRFRDAAGQYQEVLSAEEENPHALSGMATIAMEQGEWRTAEGYWRKVIEVLTDGRFDVVDQRLEKAYRHLGATLMEVREYEEAISYLREALRIRRDVADTYFLLGIAYRETDSLVKYRENIEYALRFDPMRPDANYEYGKILLEQGDEAGAAERFRVAVENAPPERTEPAEALAQFGSAEERLERSSALASTDASAALVEARIAAAVDPESVDAARAVASLYETAGDKPAALAAWQRVLDLAPRDTDAAAAVERLGAPAP